jgi:6-pyruvoyltetrahydropterin/6-carboxytetrahydropterin synthase
LAETETATAWQPHPKVSSLGTLRPQRALSSEVQAALRFELGIDSFFGASHSMRPNGERHTHSFRIQATFVTDAVDDDGMVVGFREVSNLLDAEAKKYVSRYINDIAPFDRIQPTGENIAAVVFRNLRQALAAELPLGPRLVAVTLWESPTSYVKVMGQ